MKPVEHLLLTALRDVHDELRQVRKTLDELDRRVTEMLDDKENGP